MRRAIARRRATRVATAFPKRHVFYAKAVPGSAASRRTRALRDISANVSKPRARNAGYETRARLASVKPARAHARCPPSAGSARAPRAARWRRRNRAKGTAAARRPQVPPPATENACRRARRRRSRRRPARRKARRSPSVIAAGSGVSPRNFCSAASTKRGGAEPHHALVRRELRDQIVRVGAPHRGGRREKADHAGLASPPPPA